MPQSRYRLDQGSSKNDMLSMTLPYAPAKISIYCFSLKKKEYDIQYQVYKTIHALEAQQEKPMEKTSEELVPKEYHKFLKVFSKKESEHILLRKPWDHTIHLKNTFKLKKGHIIPPLKRPSKLST